MCFVRTPKIPEPEPLADPAPTPDPITAIGKPAATQKKRGKRGKSSLIIPRNTGVGGFGGGSNLAKSIGSQLSSK